MSLCLSAVLIAVLLFSEYENSSTAHLPIRAGASNQKKGGPDLYMLKNLLFYYIFTLASLSSPALGLCTTICELTA